MASPPPQVNVVSGRYEIERELGSGGMARVWAVRERGTGRSFGLKRLSSGANRRHRALFEREYYTLSGLNHPHIVRVFDYATDGDGPYYTMELLHGSDLSRLAPLPFVQTCQILRDVASALALLHARRFLHRDVSGRNVVRTPQGSAKLIDFGTLGHFGRPGDVAGTPPYLAPEALHGHELDQRTDLYALGALGYWLLTGVHAFAARSLAALPQLWQHRPQPASAHVAALNRADLPEVPGAFDALLERLLSADAQERPHNAAEVIDALCAIAGLPREPRAREPQSYLNTPALCGRQTELRLLFDALDAAQAGRGTGLILEGAARMGKSRVLTELAVKARQASAVVLHMQADGAIRSHAVAEQLARKLLDTLPVAAGQAAKPYAATLARLSDQLRERLGLPPSAVADAPRTHGEARMRVQAALSSWFLDVASEHGLVLLIDDVQHCDAASAAWLASLARETRTRSILVVATLTSALGDQAHADGLRRHASVLPLAPLESRELKNMLRSVFGEAVHLPRLADLVAQRTEGNPGLALDLVEHLIAQGLLQYSDGTWLLPQQISDHALPSDPQGVLHARLSRLPAHARALAQVLSVREGLIPFELCTVVAEDTEALTFDALEALLREGILSASGDAYRFVREPIRQLLSAELSVERRRRAHAISAELLLAVASPTPLDRLRGGLDLLLGGDVERGSIHIARAAKHYALVDLADVGQAAATLERALHELLALGRPRQQLITLYAPLALAGYYAQRQYSDRYSQTAIDLLQDLLGLTRARRIQPRVGKKLGLWLSVGWSALRFRVWATDERVPSFHEAMSLLFNCVATSTGVSILCVDPQRAEHYANVLEPLRALGPDHVATLMHDFCLNLVRTARDGAGLTHARWQRMIERLESALPIRGLTPEVRILYLAGALYACGVIESWRDGSVALQYAQRLEDFRLKLYELSAHQIRMLCHAHQGDHAMAEHYRERVEVHAIQRGTAWQAETWSYGALIAIYVRTHNILGLKHCAQQLTRLAQDIPSLEPAARRAQGAYLTERGLPHEALAFLDVAEEPLALAGWARSRGTYAQALNSLGQHKEAQRVCLDTLAHLSPADLEFVAMSLNVQIELALSEAGLGQLEVAAERLDKLLTKLQRLEGPLTMSALHEARTQVAVLQRDTLGFERHVGCLQHWTARTQDRALVARAQRIFRGVHKELVANWAPDAAPVTDAEQRTHDLTVLNRLRHGDDDDDGAHSEHGEHDEHGEHSDSTTR